MKRVLDLRAGATSALRAGCLALLTACIPAAAAAQTVPFGKNKVQYTDFDWQVLSGPHVDVYYYPEEEELARLALVYAEESVDTLTVLFQHRLFRRIPLILYSSHQHFEQTNVTFSFIPEGVAGFTEFLKRRIALPFNGSYADFRHTIRHEIVHFFQLSKLSRTYSQYARARRIPIPLWWTEGLAERWSSPQTPEDDMYVRDLVLSGELPRLRQLAYARGFLVYPLGGAIHRYLGERFGYDRVARLYEDLWKYRDFASALEGVYGIRIEQLERELEFEFQQRFYPQYADRTPLDVAATPFLVEGGVNFKPVAYSRSGDSIDAVLFMSPRTGYTNIYSATLEGGERSVREVVRGERSAEFESLHFFRSRLDVSADRKLAFISKYLERDALFIWNLERQEVVGRYQWPDLVALSSPAWSPDGQRVVFEGLSAAGTSDLYLLTFRDQSLTRLTNDAYHDGDADVAPDGRHVVFSSDRTPFGAGGAANLFVLDLETGAIRYLTYGPWEDRDPRWSPDGSRIVFSSNRAGTYDLYVVSPDGSGHRLTHYAGGAFEPDWIDAERIIFNGFHRLSYGVYIQSIAHDSIPDAPFDLPPAEPALLASRGSLPADGDGAAPDSAGTRLAPGWHWRELRDTLVAQAVDRPYETRFSLDLAAGEAIYAPGLAAAQGAQFLATDMLGNHILFLGLSAQQVSSSLDDFVNAFSGQLLYLNLSRRLNWGGGIFRFRGRFVDRAFRNVFDEESYGGYFLASYPLSKFRRLEIVSVLEHSDRQDAFELLPTFDIDLPPDTAIDLTRKGVITSHYLSYVFDNSLWLPTGPVDGSRLNLTGGLITDLSAARAESYSLRADLRRYFRIGLRSAYAVRAYGYYSDGEVPGRITIGGTNSLRLYPRFGLFGSRVWLLNQELRYPLLDRLTLGFPFGDLTFPGIQGALFFDLAQIWLEGHDPEGTWGSWGASFRMPLGWPLVLRLDVGRRFAWGDLPTQSFFDRFEGTKVDFFFGFNY